MKLSNFKKNKKAKVIMGLSFVAIAGVAALGLYRSYALYEAKKEYNVIKGTVPEFKASDLILSMTVDGKQSQNAPAKGNYGVVVSCDNASGEWDYDKWKALIGDFKTSRAKCTIDFESKMSDYLVSLSNVSGEIIKQEHEATEQTGTDATIDYRYIGANPNNYVCLKDNNETCSEDELYRIIGVIPTQSSESGPYENRVKLIKNTSIGKYVWDENGVSNFENSTLKTKVLDSTYWSEIEPYQKYIGNAIWYVSYGPWGDTANNYYKKERSNKGVNTFIGIMSASDYGFAANGSADRNTCYNLNMGAGGDWATNPNCNGNDWLRLSDAFVLNVINSEKTTNINVIQLNSTDLNVKHEVYPSFYLKSNVKYLSGTGDQNNPYRITLE